MPTRFVIVANVQSPDDNIPPSQIVMDNLKPGLRSLGLTVEAVELQNVRPDRPMQDSFCLFCDHPAIAHDHTGCAVSLCQCGKI